MTPEEYIGKVLKTESIDLNKIGLRLQDRRTIRLLHSAIGMVTEAGEFIDALKKYIFYGKELDIINLKEELGDSEWYHGIAIDELKTSYGEIMYINIVKLQKRYGISFNENGAINRNLSAERYILEKNETRGLNDLKTAMEGEQ